MWNSVGRSGHHQQYVGNGADDWNGVSPNGRQYQNEVTQERRDLSGSDYWQMRKQNRPAEEIPAELHFKNSRIKGLQVANIRAYSDQPTPKSVKKTISIRDRICPQQKTYERLEQMQADLEQEFVAGGLTDEEYLSLSAVLDKKLKRAWVLLAKAMQWPEEKEELELYCDDFYPEENSRQDTCLKANRSRDLLGVLGTLNDDNVFKVCWCHWLSVKRFMVLFRKEIKVFVEDTKKFVDYVKAGL